MAYATAAVYPSARNRHRLRVLCQATAVLLVAAVCVDTVDRVRLDVAADSPTTNTATNTATAFDSHPSAPAAMMPDARVARGDTTGTPNPQDPAPQDPAPAPPPTVAPVAETDSIPDTMATGHDVEPTPDESPSTRDATSVLPDLRTGSAEAGSAPETRPETKPETRSETRPETRPAGEPAKTSAHPAARPAEQPRTEEPARPAKEPLTAVPARPAKKPQTAVPAQPMGHPQAVVTCGSGSAMTQPVPATPVERVMVGIPVDMNGGATPTMPGLSPSGMTAAGDLMPARGPVAAIPILAPPGMVGACPVQTGGTHDRSMG
ncbi:hypothetical protein [Saccharothrix sp.]|uniref:hypothetical protein n=1 Tax=Saccharothrix sp. TaxID=1873460 RepID=UPI002811E4E6|nr:hypothetical protein [Saccharothrix sp.]